MKAARPEVSFVPYFCVHALDKPDMLDRRQALRPDHRARLRRHDHPVRVHVGGPLLGGDGAMVGTMLIVEAATRNEVLAFLAGDPYAAAGLFETVTVTGFDWGLGRPEPDDG